MKPEGVKVVYQPIYMDNKGNIESISKVCFTTKGEAERYAGFVCWRNLKVKILAIEVI